MATRPAANTSARKARLAKIVQDKIQQKPTPVIAAELGISRQFVNRELANPENQDLIRGWFAPHHDRLQKLTAASIANVERALETDQESRQQRIADLEDLRDRLKRVIAERAQAAEILPIPGAGSGLITQDGEDYRVDTALARELREVQKAIREERNDFSPNLKAVDQARNLLELAEGRRKDGDSGNAGARWHGEFIELLAMYAKIPTPTENDA